MKIMRTVLRLLILLACVPPSIPAQQLQLHYDPRHALDPANNPRNYPSLFFQYFKPAPPDSSWPKPGAFLFQVQCDLHGDNGNVGQVYVQVSQTLKFWKPDLFLDFEYSGGLGVAEPGPYGYYLTNTYSFGVSFAIQWDEIIISPSLDLALTTFAAPSHDIRGSIYWWKGVWNYAVELAGDVQFWTQNEYHGDAGTAGLRGKRVSFLGEPQIWVNLSNIFSAGTKINIYYNILTTDGKVQVYPTIALRYKL